MDEQDDTRGEVLWEPAADARTATALGRFLTAAEAATGAAFADHEAAWRWSVDEPGAFWQALWDHVGVRAHAPHTTALADATMPGAVWFPGATLNYAEHAVAGAVASGADDHHAPAVIARSQSRDEIRLTGEQLRAQVARCATGLRRLGVGVGDVVAAYLPNVPETIVAFLATASLGAVWTSAAPEFGAKAVLDRWQQVAPKVLLVVDGYRYGTRDIARTAEADAIAAGLPALAAVVRLPYLDPACGAPVTDGPTPMTWDDLLAEDGPLTFRPVPFDHPLYVLFSSGTTGLPKPIVHGHGGILLEHHKAVGLYCDVQRGDRFFWFSTTGWMMWNFLVSGLLTGATVVLFDGDPAHPGLDALWGMADELDVTFFGTSAPFLMACRKAGLTPAADHDLATLRAVGSTGAPLPADGFRWVAEHVGDVLLTSASGGTDVCTAFVGGSPLTPVRAGEISCRFLGARIEAFDDTGTSIVGEQGELVLTAPMPSMPVGFWGDDDGSRYRDAYFDVHPGVWRHGDWVTIREDGSLVISGRSDATLNRGGVRIGTAEFYAVVDSLPGVADSLVVHLEDDEGGSGELLLFVAPAAGTTMDDAAIAEVRRQIRGQLSPRHVPDEVVVVPTVPRTLSGKKLEVPVKRILLGTPPEEAAARGALADPSSLDAIVAYAAAR